jgi:PIN domain nuclease of toxin-antitoxin system
VILLLDAHAVLCALADPEKVVPEVRRSIEDPANDVLVSAASIWELEIKRASGKLELDADLLDELERVAFDVLPMTAADAVAAARLPAHHRDPFDRMVIAQAQRLDATVVTRDGAFGAYEVDVLRA